MSTELAVREPREVSGFEMKPKTLEEAMRFCEIMADSDLVPKDYKGKPGNIMVAIQMGAELGLSPMRSIKSIAVINGRPSMWGDEMLAMVLASPLCEYVDESESSEKQGVCKVKRKGHPEHVSVFTLQDAQRAGLLGKPGPWTNYQPRQMKLRARGFGLRDKFADVLAGLIPTEEAMDIPVDDQAQQEGPALHAPLSLKDKLKAQLQPVEPAPPETGPLVVDEMHQTVSALVVDDATVSAATAQPQLNAGNVCRQLRLCESIPEWADLRNQWEAEKHLHSEADRTQVMKVFDEVKKRLGRK